MLSEKLETASWRTQQMSTQINVDVSLLLDSTVHSVMQDLLNKVRDMRRSVGGFVVLRSLFICSFAMRLRRSDV